MGEASGLRYIRGEIAGFTEDTKVRVGLRTIVEAQDGFDGTDEFGWEGDAAFADAIGLAVVGFVDEGDTEGLLHAGDSTEELDGATLGAWGVGRNGKAVLLGEGAD